MRLSVGYDEGAVALVIAGRRGEVIEAFVRTDLIVLVTPRVESLLPCLRGSPMKVGEHLDVERPPQAFHLSLGLRMLYPSLDMTDSTGGEICPKGRTLAALHAKLRPMVGQGLLW